MKKLITLLIVFYGYIQASDTSAIDESMYDAKICSTGDCASDSYYFAADLVAEKRVASDSLREKSFKIEGSSHFLHADQYMVAIVDKQVKNIEQVLEESLSDKFPNVFETLAAPAAEASLLIANRNDLLIGVKGPNSKIIVLGNNDARREYRNRTVAIRTPTTRAVLLLRGFKLPNDVIADLVQWDMNEGKTASSTIKHIIGFEMSHYEEHTIAAAMLNLDHWNTKEVPVVAQLTDPESTTPSALSTKRVGRGCCELL